MIDLCQYAVGVGERIGADEVEAVWVKHVTTGFEAASSEISKASMKKKEIMRIRVVKNKALGSAYTYFLDNPGVKTAVNQALRAAHASRKDEHWDSFPSRGGYSLLDVWDSAMETIRPEDMLEPVIEMLQSVPDDISVCLAENHIMLCERACANSCGIEHAERGALGKVGMMVVGILGDEVTPEFQQFSYMREYSPAPREIAQSLVDRVALFKKSEPAFSGRTHIILSPSALEGLFNYTLFMALSGENVARGKSLLAEKEGETVASSAFTLHDNGIIPEGPASREMDDEGVPCQDTPLIEEGVLQGFIWNDYWAKRVGVTSTGNAYYSDYFNEMTIHHTMMVAAQGDYKVEELFDVKDGYYFQGFQGIYSSNPESGDFSLVCAPAYRIRNGEISGGVVGVMLSDNVFSLIQKIDAVGCEVEVCENTLLPPVRFSDVNVVAK